MCPAVSKREMKFPVSDFFPWCPFCCFEELEVDLRAEQNCGFILCENCGAKWEITLQDEIKAVKLIATSIDWKGKDLIGKETDPKFWQTKAWICVITRRVPEKSYDTRARR